MFLKRSLEDRVEKAKIDQKELNKLIEVYKPFIANILYKKKGKFLQYGCDDELTIGMMAFKEAVEAYDKKKGKFLSFAKHVISLRSIDHYRKNEKMKDKIWLPIVTQSDDKSENSVMDDESIKKYEYEKENELRRLEISEYKKELKKWDIEFADLLRTCPKQDRLKKVYKEIAQFIIMDSKILNRLIITKRLPIKEIQGNMLIHRKKIERGRLYIIALVIALKGDYDLIREYIIN
ncbi:RNA polymerase sigma factor SigI [Clostridium pasteurianum DSM 525 = ATCC 6013]|uniref:RNA polymerase sigma factor SigI n=1 Tax=Clostridium pasteurianum DSM 525 = ATCC 6013 TaxID=1262449 RepID=A0A0H3J8R8_CLOPA|nr:RNA polymerase sigma-I factor [Clostridium pasteurianum]AJA49879.1 RNA polymerase sigma factor SigI [Clostridium pasteurianum DSM 525 = ATCC 6013]AJA53867.1 RNA polymerase sigma factor SigI [Clostridium pasteurianum DSM 525 = ATCC 6013]AOZ77022.1 RNA polymerase subunit sigma [Clostridium pasteurianum DSM 525 = ATCC 6013]AOZ80819.1 RNA polymerase subunit sigma [Clostridium pasteurianum]ELP57839.1 RNA polymerase sigma factor SigI [Clostridium pasteurianum DSM 525 = ATCC 6013]